MLPGMHGIDKENDWRVVDNTWAHPKQSAYFGIPFDERYVRAPITAKGRYGVVDDWKRRYPVLNADPAAFPHEDAARIPRNFPH